MNPIPPLPEEAHPDLDRLKELCPMRCQAIDVKEETVFLWTACDVDPLLEDLSHRPGDDPYVKDDRMPYWAELWNSAKFLASTLQTRKDSLPANSWLELGCGPGLPGLTAARMGIPGIATDYMKEAEWLSRVNAYQNHCEKSVAYRRLDWREPPADLKSPWILAADVAYEERNFQPLISCFNAVLSPGGEIWLAEPGRSIARPFFLELEEAEWEVKTLAAHPPITIHRLRRATDG